MKMSMVASQRIANAVCHSLRVTDGPHRLLVEGLLEQRSVAHEEEPPGRGGAQAIVAEHRRDAT